MQPVQILLVDTANQVQLELPIDLDGGEVLAGQVAHKNLVPLPFISSGPATLRLELVTGRVLDLNGRDLPDDFRPSDAG